MLQYITNYGIIKYGILKTTNINKLTYSTLQQCFTTQSMLYCDTVEMILVFLSTRNN